MDAAGNLFGTTVLGGNPAVNGGAGVGTVSRARTPTGSKSPHRCVTAVSAATSLGRHLRRSCPGAARSEFYRRRSGRIG
jgi:hypothetical protein